MAIASRQSPDDADMLVRSAILAEGELAQQQGFKPSEYEDILHRDLFLAARCLADDVPVYPKLRQQIVNRLCELYFDPKSPWSLKEDIRQSFALLDVSNTADDLAEILIRRVADSDGDVRSAVARALGWLLEKGASDHVVASLLPLLADSYEAVRSAAAFALGSLGEKVASNQVVALLLPLLTYTEWTVRHEAAYALGSLVGVASELVFASLLPLLADSVEYVRNAAISALGNLASLVKDADKQKIIKLALPLARNKGRGEKNDSKREAGYVMLRNLLVERSADGGA